MPANVGVLGGTFDPIHVGHLHIAQKTREAFCLSGVHFVVAQTPPHKRSDQVSSAYHRFAMVAQATAPYADFTASTLELEPGASPYTVDTLYALTRMLGLSPRHLFFLAGGDSFLNIHTWRNFEEILTTFNVIFVERPDARIGTAPERLPQKIRERIEDLRPLGLQARVPDAVRQGRQEDSRVYLLEIGAPEVSSTAVRLQGGVTGETRHWIPEPVAEYIQKYRLYRT